MRKLFRLAKQRPNLDRELDDELDYHIDAVTAELVERGYSQDDARREAHRRFGDMTQHRANIRRVDQASATRTLRRTQFEDTMTDVRYALRALLREPVFTLGVVATLALGIGANATMFGVIDRLLLRPAPHVRNTPEMTLVYLSKPGARQPTVVQASTSYPDYVLLRDSAKVFKELAAYWTTDMSLGLGAVARRKHVGLVTGNFFNVLGVRATRGRFFTAAEDDPTVTEPPVVLSDETWRNEYASDPAIIGRVVQLNGTSYTVVGVAPTGFNGAQMQRVDFWVPLRATATQALNSNWESSRNMYWLRMVGERRADLSPSQASQRATAVHREANRIAKRRDSLATVVLGSIVPSRGAAGSGGMVSGDGSMGGAGGLTPQAQISLWLGGVAIIVMLIACANVANLLLARSGKRRREIAVRLAIGIQRGRLIRQLLTESIVLALLAGVVALFLTYLGSQVMRRMLMTQVASDMSALDARVLAFSLVSSLFAAVLAGLAPALLSSSPVLTVSLRSGTRDGGPRRGRMQRALLIAQAAMSVILLVGAGLFVRSLRNVSNLRLGYDADSVLIAQIDASQALKEPAQVDQFWLQAQTAIAALPGVESATLVATTPFQSAWAEELSVPGLDSLPDLPDGGPYVNAVTNEYFTTMGTRVVQGRTFHTGDVAGSERVAVVNQTMARLLWPGKNAVGQCMKVGGDTTPCVTVIGVSEDSYRQDVRESGSAQYVVLQSQNIVHVLPGLRSLAVRTKGPPGLLRQTVANTLQTLRPSLPYADVSSLREIINPELRQWRLGATMFGVFGTLALVVAAIGLYSVIAYDVAQRRHELGVRVALGARPSMVLRLVLREGVRYATVGAGVGAVIAFAIAPRLQDLLFGVSGRDPITYAAVLITILGSAVLATLAPARRASTVAPAEVLRSD